MTRNLIQTTFELQRQSIERSFDAVDRSLELQQSVARAARDNLETGQSIQQRGVELGARGLHAYVDAFAATTLGEEESLEEVHELIDEQFDVLERTTDDTWEAMETTVIEGMDAYDDLTETQRDLLQDSTDAFLESYEEVESSTIEITGEDED